MVHILQDLPEQEISRELINQSQGQNPSEKPWIYYACRQLYHKYVKIWRFRYENNRIRWEQKVDERKQLSYTQKKSREEQCKKLAPTRIEIFLPTDKVPIEKRIVGLEKIRSFYSIAEVNYNKLRFESLKKKRQLQQRCFIIGNGPSLNDTDLGLLKDEVTFGVNGIFLKFDENFCTTYYVVEDHLVAEDRAPSINNISQCTKIFPFYLSYCLDKQENVIFINHRPRKSYPDGFDFSTEASEITYTGGTVTFTCLQLAYYLGFKEIYLIGVDHNYVIPADTERSLQYDIGQLDMKSDDPNHFDPDYFGKGYRWHVLRCMPIDIDFVFLLHVPWTGHYGHEIC